MKPDTLMRSIFITCMVAAGSLQASNELPSVTVDGLHRLGDTELAIVYAQPGADLSQYTRINLADARVAFKKNWLRDQNRGSRANRVTASDMDRMKTELADMFREVFTETLVEGGYELVAGRGEDVLVVKPAIINLDLAAPDTMTGSFSRSYAESAGEMTLYVELYDSVTDDLLAKALDRQIDRETGHFQWQNRVTNRAAARRILKEWAEVLKEGLDAARTPGAR